MEDLNGKDASIFWEWPLFHKQHIKKDIKRENKREMTEKERLTLSLLFDYFPAKLVPASWLPYLPLGLGRNSHVQGNALFSTFTMLKRLLLLAADGILP